MAAEGKPAPYILLSDGFVLTLPITLIPNAFPGCHTNRDEQWQDL